jgi:hypothetical protein
VLRPAVRKRKQTARILSNLDMAFPRERVAELPWAGVALKAQRQSGSAARARVLP